MKTLLYSPQFFWSTGALVILAVLIVGLLAWNAPEESVLPVTKALPVFSQYEAGPARKSAFFNYFEPIIDSENERILELREKLLTLRDQERLGEREQDFVKDMASRHRVKRVDVQDELFWENLLRKVDVVPASLALAQAANESAWGTSRFARSANNYFGQWCFKAGCGVVPASRDAGKQHEVAAFDHPAASVRGYVRNLNSHPAYKPLRQLREKLRQQGETISGMVLAEGLKHYSERGDHYVEELQSMIRYNKLHQLDSV